MARKTISTGVTLADEIRAAGARVTPVRLSVLALLRAAVSPVSHADLEVALTQDIAHVDRVTLYRVLDWLVDSGLAHKAADARGVFRFSAAEPSTDHKAHVHFRCTDCGGVFCIDTPRPVAPKLPKGFRLSGMELDIRGECAQCIESHHA